MLAWEGDVNVHSHLDEDVAVVIESRKGILKTINVLSRYSITACNEAEVTVSTGFGMGTESALARAILAC